MYQNFQASNISRVKTILPLPYYLLLFYLCYCYLHISHFLMIVTLGFFQEADHGQNSQIRNQKHT